MDPEDLMHLRVTEQDVFPSYHVWPMPLAAPYRNSFTRAIENLHATGILNRWYFVISLAFEQQTVISILLLGIL